MTNRRKDTDEEEVGGKRKNRASGGLMSISKELRVITRNISARSFTSIGIGTPRAPVGQVRYSLSSSKSKDSAYFYVRRYITSPQTGFRGLS